MAIRSLTINPSRAVILHKLMAGLPLAVFAHPVQAQLLAPPGAREDWSAILLTLLAFAALIGCIWLMFQWSGKCVACGKRHTIEPTYETNENGDEQWRCRNCGHLSWNENPFGKKKKK